MLRKKEQELYQQKLLSHSKNSIKQMLMYQKYQSDAWKWICTDDFSESHITYKKYKYVEQSTSQVQLACPFDVVGDFPSKMKAKELYTL